MSDFNEDLANLATKEEEGVKDGVIDQGSQPETVKTEPAPSQVEQKAAETKPEEPASTKEVPFHKHPRWIRTQNELKELRDRVAKEAEQKPTETVVAKASGVPEEFQKLFGDDVKAYEAWKKFQRQEAESIYEARTKKDQELAQQAEKATQKAVSFVEEQFLNLADETGIAFTDKDNTERNQILNICQKYSLFGADGLPNIQAANELRAVLHPPEADTVKEEKKKVLAKTNARSNSSGEDSKVITSSKLKKMSMSQFFN